MAEQESQTTLRDTIAANFDDHIEEGEEQEHRQETQQEQQEDQAAIDASAEQQQTQEEITDPLAELPHPSTWKKEYYPLWEKLGKGEPLTAEEGRRLQEYTEQRESQYKTGVSTYKAEAEQARQLQEAMAPFMPELQQHGINPQTWISNLGNAHRVLSLGNAEQKMQMFAQLAQEYGIPLQGVAQMLDGQQVDPLALQMANELQSLRNQTNTLTSWQQQQEEAGLMTEINAVRDDKENFPHFDLVRGQMAQLLENGEAPDLKTAYEMAAKPIEDLKAQWISQSAQTGQQKVKLSAQSKAKAVSPRSATPSGKVTDTTVNAQDRRAVLAEQVDALLGGGRV